MMVVMVMIAIARAVAAAGAGAAAVMMLMMVLCLRGSGQNAICRVWDPTVAAAACRSCAECCSPVHVGLCSCTSCLASRPEVGQSLP